MPKRYHLIVLLIVALLSLAGLSPAAAQVDDGVLNIVTTTTQTTDLTTILAGDLVGESVEITGLMGAGVDPHLYQPKEQDIAAMNAADLVVYSGLHLEGKFDEVFQGLGERNIRTYPVSQPVKDAGYVIGGFTLSEELTNVDDPHFWFDPRNWQLAAEGLASVLGEVDPTHADIYTANYAAYSAQLDLLYNWAFDAMSEVDPQQRTLVTSHDAFQYFGAAFGWKVRGLQGISTASEAGVGDVQDLADFVARNNIPVMFVESSVPPNTIAAVEEAVSAKGAEVGLGVRVLYSDAMGEKDTFGGTYIGMLAENVITILQSFGYDVPAWPEELTPVPLAELLDIGAS